MKKEYDYIKAGVCIALVSALLIVSAYALFLLLHILIIYPAVHILPLAVALEIITFSFFCVYFLIKYFRNNSGFRPVLILIFILWLTPQVSFIAYVEYEYNIIEDDYSDFAEEKALSGETEVAISWNISKKYLESFQSSQNDITIPVPVRCIYQGNSVIAANLLLNHYLFEMDGLLKLVVTDRRGNCSEYAGAVSYLLNRIQKSVTRVVVIYGYDHKIAEVKYENRWYILDPLKTTPDYPVEASCYSARISSLSPEISGSIISVKTDEGKDVTAEHGF